MLLTSHPLSENSTVITLYQGPFRSLLSCCLYTPVGGTGNELYDNFLIVVSLITLSNLVVSHVWIIAIPDTVNRYT